MMKFIEKKMSISKIFFFNMFIISTLSIFIIGFIWIKNEHIDFVRQSSKIKSEYLDKQKASVKDAVEHAINFIEYKEVLTERRLKDSIKQRVYEAFGIAENIYQNSVGKLPDDEIIKLIKHALRPVRFFDNRNYYFIDDLEGNSVLFPPEPDFEGKNLMHIVNKEGVRPFPDIIKLVQEKGEGYYFYNWVKYTEGAVLAEKEYPKITYFKGFKPYNWFIAVGEYQDYIANDIKQEILERVSKIRTRDGDFIAIYTYDGIKMVSGGEIVKSPVKESDTIEHSEQKFVENQIKAALANNESFLNYNFIDKATGISRPRLLHAKRHPAQNWIVTAGSFMDESNQIIAQKKVELEKHEKDTTFKIITILFGLWLFSFIVARYVSFKAKSSFTTFTQFFKAASNKNVRMDPNELHFTEFSELAISGNKMVEDRQRTEQELQKNEKKYQDLYDNSPDMYASVDAETKNIMECNNTLVNKLGYKKDDIIGKPIFSVYHPDSLTDANTAFQKFVNTGKVYNAELQLRKKDGSKIDVILNVTAVYDEHRNILYSRSAWRDITELKKANLEVKKAQELFQKVFESQMDSILILDAEVPAKITKCNKATEIIFGYSTNELIGRETNLLHVDNDHLKKFQQKLFPAIELEGLLRDFQFEMKRIDGSVFPSEHAVLELKNEKGQRTGWLSIVKDISEKKEMEERIFQAQKMESIGNLAGGIAHDFNNILFPIVGMSELLLEDLPPDSLEHENANEILKAGRRGSELVKQILTFSRQNEHKMMPVRIQQILKEVLKLSRSSIPIDIEIKKNIQQNCGMVDADSTQIHQVAMNLITNAYHAVEASGGEIIVELSETDCNVCDLQGTSLTSGFYAVLTVSDNGMGIDPTVLHKIFEPYFTTKQQGKGTGLGLSVVYGIVKAHKGDIKVDSELGKGTTITVYLPLIEKLKLSKDIETIVQIPTGTERLLIVDDEISVALLEKQMLERLGYTVSEYTSSQAALEAFRQAPNFYDLVICDMTMPNMTGDRLARVLISIRSDIPIIICTGFSERIDIVKSEAIGIRGFLMKPVIKSDMAQMVRKVLDEANVYKGN